MHKPRVGLIEFLNCFPLYYGLVKNNILLDIELLKGTPAELNARLLKKYDAKHSSEMLDVCSVSSIVYAHNRQNFMLMPNISISSDKDVMSVCLVSKKKVAELGNSLVALTNTSATSHILLKIILSDKYNVRPDYIECAPNLTEMLARADAALLIGNPALYVNYQKPPGLYVYDLGREWQELTGRKMVYGLWVISRDFARERKYLALKLSRDFAQAVKDGLKDIEIVAAKAAAWECYPPDFLKEYFLTLKYTLSDTYQQGLLEYYRRAKEHNFIKEVPSLDFLEA